MKPSFPFSSVPLSGRSAGCDAYCQTYSSSILFWLVFGYWLSYIMFYVFFSFSSLSFDSFSYRSNIFNSISSSLNIQDHSFAPLKNMISCVCTSHLFCLHCCHSDFTSIGDCWYCDGFVTSIAIPPIPYLIYHVMCHLATTCTHFGFLFILNPLCTYIDIHQII